MKIITRVFAPACGAAALLFAACVAAQAGRVMVAVGEVTVQRAGQTMAAPTGTLVGAGDTIAVGAESNAQIRFTDGGIVALRANSAFRVDEYRFDAGRFADARAIFSLVKGGLRALTGLVPREHFQMKTKVATLGIRGTHFALVLCEPDSVCRDDDGVAAPDGVYGGVFEGHVVLNNDGGAAEFGVDEFFYVANAGTPAKAMLQRPGFLRDRLEARARREREQRAAERGEGDGTRAPIGRLAQQSDRDPRTAAAGNLARAGTALDPRLVAGSGVVATELRDGTGNVAVLGPGLGISVAFSGNSARSLTDGGTSVGLVINDKLSAPERFRILDGEVVGTRDGASVADVGGVRGDGAMYWGRWLPGGTVSVFGTSADPGTGVHFVYGALTPPDVFAKPVANIGVGASNYDYVGGTQPTNDRGSVGQFVSGGFSVDFLARTIAGGVTYRIGGVEFVLAVPNGTAIQARPGVTGFNFAAHNVGTWICLACAANGPNARGTLDSYNISGLFLGSRAQGLGITFSTLDAVTGRTAGATAFTCRSCRK